jgi:hypothetical protein
VLGSIASLQRETYERQHAIVMGDGDGTEEGDRQTQIAYRFCPKRRPRGVLINWG